ncbi:riboflavin biosynthesis protein RibD [Rhodospirillales bacterium TMPK1]|uniref:Riboflavin biosynthesis protein RibD n=2 Tax=Roseiterribacter gracilis TaxID=2812848 RepID=A0A8S8XBK4_9PROT|nr:riboflavin biosynthesis protein RibD [Rhodospirillales bacterium TMPK1]
MRVALHLARRGLGEVWPNPAVGCVLVKDGVVVGRGWTQSGGRPHAETEALRRAGDAARGATAYVTLEPCSHTGQTPPCVDALIAAGVARVVVAIGDPDPRVDGRGLARLRDAKIEVTEHVESNAARAVTAGFLLRVEQGRPLVTLKLATSLDGRIATHGGDSKWITGEDARAAAHALRAEHDAVAVGASTAVADDPALTVRLPGWHGRGKPRVVFDRHLRLSLTSSMVKTARTHPTWVLTLADADKARRSALEDLGVEILPVEPIEPGRMSMLAALEVLAGRGITRLLVEGGGRIAASLLAEKLVDRLILFRAGRVLGGDGVPAIAGLGIATVAEGPVFRRSDLRPLGPDAVEFWERSL